MPPRFTAPSLMLSRAVDTHFGEMLRFVPKPKTDSFGAPINVDGRQPVIVIGTFNEGDREATFSDGDRRISDFNSRMSQQDVWASVEKSLFMPEMLPRKNDLMETLDRSPVQTFEILDAVNDGVSRLSFLLVRSSEV